MFEDSDNKRGWRLAIVERLGERLRAVEVWDLERGVAGWHAAVIQTSDRQRVFVGERLVSVPYCALDALRRWGECERCYGAGSVEIGPNLGTVQCSECHGRGYFSP